MICESKSTWKLELFFLSFTICFTLFQIHALQLGLTQYLDITRYVYCCNKCSCQFLTIRYMSHLRESLNDLLGSNFRASYNSYKKAKKEQQYDKPISFTCWSLPTLLPKKRKHNVLKQFLLKSKYLYPLKSRYRIISKI